MTAGARLRLGVIGVGAMGARHAENIATGPRGDFVRATLDGRAPTVTGDDGRRALAIALAADAAGEQGAEVAVG